MIDAQNDLRRPSIQKLFEFYYHDENTAEELKKKEDAATATLAKSESTQKTTNVVVTKGEHPPQTSYTDHMMSDRDHSNSKRGQGYL